MSFLPNLVNRSWITLLAMFQKLCRFISHCLNKMPLLNILAMHTLSRWLHLILLCVYPILIGLIAANLALCLYPCFFNLIYLVMPCVWQNTFIDSTHSIWSVGNCVTSSRFVWINIVFKTLYNWALHLLRAFLWASPHTNVINMCSVLFTENNAIKRTTQKQ